jgi:hypothetical protein
MATAGASNSEITPEMIRAGAAVLQDLKGEASKAFLAEAVYRAMAGSAAVHKNAGCDAPKENS